METNLKNPPQPPFVKGGQGGFSNSVFCVTSVANNK
jgi:hypothetical protein